jgi:hypothetical protein
VLAPVSRNDLAKDRSYPPIVGEGAMANKHSVAACERLLSEGRRSEGSWEASVWSAGGRSGGQRSAPERSRMISAAKYSTILVTDVLSLSGN